MNVNFFTSLRTMAVWLFITGALYPACVTITGRLIFPEQSEGSLILTPQGAVGSKLIGQQFHGEEYFWPRPSASGSFAYNAELSSGSNLAPSNPKLIDDVSARVSALRDSTYPTALAVPVDLVTTSASGLDPDISPAAGYFQLARIARARRVDPTTLVSWMRLHITPGTFGILGEQRINVLMINLALDRDFPLTALPG